MILIVTYHWNPFEDLGVPTVYSFASTITWCRHRSFLQSSSMFPDRSSERRKGRRSSKVFVWTCMCKNVPKILEQCLLSFVSCLTKVSVAACGGIQVGFISVQNHFCWFFCSISGKKWWTCCFDSFQMARTYNALESKPEHWIFYKSY